MGDNGWGWSSSLVQFCLVFIAAAGESCQPSIAIASIAIASLTAISANISWSASSGAHEPPTVLLASCTVDETDVQVEPDSRHDVVELPTESVPGRKGEDGTNHYYATAQIPVKVQSVGHKIRKLLM